MGREREGQGRVTDQRTTWGENTVFGEGQRKVGRERGGTGGLEEEGRSVPHEGVFEQATSGGRIRLDMLGSETSHCLIAD